jgi:CSLREA domain-containing protein
VAAIAVVCALAPSAAPAATINVTIATDTVANDAQCSLREAVTVTNNDNVGTTGCVAVGAFGPDTITLAASTTYHLTIPTTIEDSNADGDLDIDTTMGTDGLTIQGVGSGSTAIDEDLVDRVIQLKNGPMTLTGLTVSGGNMGNGGSSIGGGIWINSTGNLTLNQSTVSGNDADYGGGISAYGPLTATDSTIQSNGALGATGTLYGGGIDSSIGAVSLTRTTVFNNKAITSGGGINASSASLTLDSSLISSNTVSSPDDATSPQPQGGGIFANNSPVTLTNSTIASNSATTTDAVATLPQPRGGGFYNGAETATIIGSTFSANSVSEGNAANREAGGIFNSSSGTLTLRNSTLSGNSAPGGNGGALLNNNGNATLAHVTITGNSAGTGMAIANTETTGSLALRGTLVANGATACFNFTGVITSNGYNIDQGSSCGLATATDLQNVTNPMLDGLANNGGPTQTHALLAGSPAIDHVLNADCDDENSAPLTVDQRGFTRPVPAGGACDTGSFEFVPTPATAPTPPSAAPTAPVATENPACAALRAKLKKAKTKKQKRKIRRQLRALGC